MSTVLKGLQDLRKQGLLCDISLQGISGATFKAHKVVLASCSEYFRALFTGMWSEVVTEQPVIKLDSIPDTTLEQILDALYTGTLNLSEENVESLLSASGFLGIPRIQEMCIKELKGQLKPGNCLQILSLAHRVDCHELMTYAAQEAQVWFGKILSSDAVEHIGCLPKHVLLELLTSESLQVGSEAQVLQAVLLWLQSDLTARHQFAPELLKAVRLPPHSLQSTIDNVVRGQEHIAAFAPAEAREAVDALQDAVTERQRSHDAASPCPVPRRTMKSGLLVCGGRTNGWLTLRTTELYDPICDSWSTVATLPCDMPFASSAALLSGVCVIAGATWSSAVYHYNRQADTWQRSPGLHKPRLHSATASLWDSVYVMGGRTADAQNSSSEVESTERISAASQKWVAAADLCRPRQCHGAAAIGNALYVVGGQGGRDVYSSMECYDEGTDRWMLCSPRMRSERKYCGVAELEGRLVAVGGMDCHRGRLSSVEALDPREGVWQPLPSLSVPRSSCGVASLNGTLYVVGGTSPLDDALATVEAFDASAGAWRPRAALAYSRTGHTLAAC